MTRRDLVRSAIFGAVGSAPVRQPRMAVEGYIFQQYAERLHKPLPDVVEEALAMASDAGFKNLELSPAFLTPPMRARVLHLLRAHGLAMPSVYVGGTLHEKLAAEQTIATAVQTGAICAPFGCKAIVTNPDPKPGDAAKSDAELSAQAAALNQMGRTLAQNGFELRVHHHTPQLTNHAREWRHILQHTDPEHVHICVDVDWAYEGGFEPIPFLREVGARLREIHVRSARNKLWLEDLEDSDIDYRKVAEYLKAQSLTPFVVVELAYRANTVVTRPLQQDLRISRIYAERMFDVKADE